MTTENPLWMNNRIQFARLLCELVATQDKLNLHEVAISMDLGLSDVKALLDRANDDWEASKARVAAGTPDAELEYTFEHLEAAACMWEYVMERLRRPHPDKMHWEEYKDAHGMAALRATVIVHAPELEAHYQEAVANGYDKDFDWQYVPKYMEDHVTRILT